jgi:subtilisin-like proprotein convertase family protein
VDVTIRLNHTWISDLDIFLFSPSGTAVLLFSGQGGSGDNLQVTVFDDQASASIEEGVAPFNGRFRPLDRMSTLAGQSTRGTWELLIADMAASDAGVLQSWSLEFVAGPSCPTPSPSPQLMRVASSSASAKPYPRPSRSPKPSHKSVGRLPIRPNP